MSGLYFTIYGEKTKIHSNDIMKAVILETIHDTSVSHSMTMPICVINQGSRKMINGRGATKIGQS